MSIKEFINYLYSKNQFVFWYIHQFIFHWLNILDIKTNSIMNSGLANVKQVMNKSIISVEKNDAIRTAIKKMVRGDIGSLLVTSEGVPTGIITERDILKSFATEKLEPENKVETIMSSPLISVDSNASLNEAAEIMLTNNVRRLMVTENDKYVGIISQRELQRFIIESR